MVKVDGQDSQVVSVSIFVCSCGWDVMDIDVKKHQWQHQALWDSILQSLQPSFESPGVR